jgi:hypothetical protein
LQRFLIIQTTLIKLWLKYGIMQLLLRVAGQPCQLQCASFVGLYPNGKVFGRVWKAQSSIAQEKPAWHPE